MTRVNRRNLLALFSLMVLFFSVDARRLERVLLDEIPYGAQVAIQVMQLKENGEDLSKKSMFLRFSDNKGINKNKFPGHWRLDDKGHYLEMKQIPIKDIGKDENAKFYFHKSGDDVGFKNGKLNKFISIHRERKKKYNWGKAKETWEKRDKGTVHIDDEHDKFDKWTKWRFEAESSVYGYFRLRHTEEVANGYICSPVGDWAQGYLFTAVGQDGSDKRKFQNAKKKDGLVFKIHILKGPDTKTESESPVDPEKSKLFDDLGGDPTVGILVYNMGKPGFLRVDGDKLIFDDKKNLNNKECKFTLLRKDSWVGLRSQEKNKTLQYDKNGDKKLKFNNNNFKGYEEWSLEPVDYDNKRSIARLRSGAGGGYLTIHKDGRAWASPENSNRPALKQEAQLLRIVKIDEVPKS